MARSNEETNLGSVRRLYKSGNETKFVNSSFYKSKQIVHFFFAMILFHIKACTKGLKVNKNQTFHCYRPKEVCQFS